MNLWLPDQLSWYDTFLKRKCWVSKRWLPARVASQIDRAGSHSPRSIWQVANICACCDLSWAPGLWGGKWRTGDNWLENHCNHASGALRPSTWTGSFLFFSFLFCSFLFFSFLDNWKSSTFPSCDNTDNLYIITRIWSSQAHLLALCVKKLIKLKRILCSSEFHFSGITVFALLQCNVWHN